MHFLGNTGLLDGIDDQTDFASIVKDSRYHRSVIYVKTNLSGEFFSALVK